jgi:hypothetical protein
MVLSIRRSEPPSMSIRAEDSMKRGGTRLTRAVGETPMTPDGKFGRVRLLGTSMSMTMKGWMPPRAGPCAPEVAEFRTHTPTPPTGAPTRHLRCALLAGPGGSVLLTPLVSAAERGKGSRADPQGATGKGREAEAGGNVGRERGPQTAPKRPQEQQPGRGERARQGRERGRERSHDRERQEAEGPWRGRRT